MSGARIVQQEAGIVFHQARLAVCEARLLMGRRAS